RRPAPLPHARVAVPVEQRQAHIARKERDLEQIEIALLLEAIYRRYGFDFRQYASASLKRRVWRRIHGEKLQSVSGLIEKVLHDPNINQAVLERARRGVFPLAKMQDYTQNYIRAGGARAFSEYYVAEYDGAQFRRSLLENVVFAQHNLVQDSAFNEFHLIVCRNVMIYFDKPLQDQVHRLFYESLPMFGLLALGQKEAIAFTPYA